MEPLGYLIIRSMNYVHYMHSQKKVKLYIIKLIIIDLYIKFNYITDNCNKKLPDCYIIMSGKRMQYYEANFHVEISI